ncbi:hypothetical protein [Glycomyces sp. NRRL B-16210]|nr:hypothetical protein [Glycomyces sp. NRRL B-16210]
MIAEEVACARTAFRRNAKQAFAIRCYIELDRRIRLTEPTGGKERDRL